MGACPRRAPIPGDSPPDTPVVIVVRLRVLEMLAGTGDANLTGCRRAQARNSVARDKIARRVCPARKVCACSWRYDERDLNFPAAVFLARYGTHDVITVGIDRNNRPPKSKISFRRRKLYVISRDGRHEFSRGVAFFAQRDRDASTPVVGSYISGDNE